MNGPPDQNATHGDRLPSPPLFHSGEPPASAGHNVATASLLVGLIVLGVSTTVLLGYLTDRTAWIQWGFAGPVMRFNTAVLAILSGLGLVGLGLGWSTAARAAGIVVFLGGALTLLQFPFQADFGIDDLFFNNPYDTVPLAGSRMGANSALCYSLIGLALIAMSPHRDRSSFLTALFASAALAVAFVALVGHLTGLDTAHGWGGSYGMSVSSAICFTLTGGWLTVLAVVRGSRHLYWWHPLVVGNAAVIGSIILWHAMELQDDRRVHHELAIQFALLHTQLSDTLAHLETSLHRMAQRWDVQGGTPKMLWKADAGNYLKDLPSLRAAAWLDSRREVRWAVGTSDARIAAAVSENPNLATAIDSARRSRRPGVASEVDRSADGGRRTWLCLPLSPHGVDDGCLLAIVDVEQLVGAALERVQISGQIVTVRDGSRFIYANTEDDLEGDPAFTETAELPFADARWTLTDMPTRSWVARKRSWLPAVTLVAALLLSLLSTVVLQLGMSVRENYRLAVEANASLKKEAEDRIATDKRLRQTLALQQAILDGANPSIISTTTDGTIRVFNKAAERMLGYKADEVIGTTTPAVVHDPDEIKTRAEELSEELGRPVEPGFDVFIAKPSLDIPDVHEWTYIRKDGVRLPVLLSITPIRESQSTITGYVGIASDITGLKQVEGELRRAKAAAEAASRAKSEFLANMSHEIRTPMNGVLGMAELALGTRLDDEQREYMETIKDSAEALLVVINDILDFSKVEAGKLALEEVAFNLREKLETTVNAMTPRAAKKGLKVRLNIDDVVPERIVGDPDRLRQIVVNLLGNALKFTERGEIALTLERQEPPNSVKDGCLLLFSVSDTGVGIPDDKQRIIFDAFSQADTSTTRKFGGTGLGLAISSRLVGLMGGQIWVESEVGRGSTFHFTARFRIATSRDEEAETLGPEDLHGMPVLVVDDNATNRRVLHDILANWHMEPTLVGSAGEAETLVEEASSRGAAFPLVLMDYLMPEVDGFDLVEKIRKHPCCRESTFMMLSSASTSDEIERCKRLGIETYLQKPISQSGLLRAVLSALSRTRNGGEAVREAMRSAAETDGRAPSPPMRTLKILLAEDNPINQKVAVTMLRNEGHSVTVAGDGKEALAAIESENFDLVFMDVQMPVMDGLQAVRAIRQVEQTSGRHLPIVAMTAHAMKGDEQRCLDAGMDGYVSKPVHSEELRRAIASAVSEEEAGTEQEPSATREDFEATGTAGEDVVYDRAAALEMVAGNEELLAEVIGVLTEDAPKSIDEIRAAVESHDPKRLERAAHRLKGSIASFFAPAATTVAQELETMGREGTLRGAKETADRLEHEFRRLLNALADSKPVEASVGIEETLTGEQIEG